MNTTTVYFNRVGNDYQAVAYVTSEDELTESQILSPIVGEVCETVHGLRSLLPNHKLKLTCVRCDATDSRDNGVDCDGLCDYCRDPNYFAAVNQADARFVDRAYGRMD